MKRPSLYLDGLDFFQIEPAAGKSIFDMLRHSSGRYKIDESIWRNYSLPSPLQAPDCSYVYVSGLIPSCISSIGDITLDIIRKETNPKKGEPDFNCYFHYFIKNSDSLFYMTKQLPASPHWAVMGELEDIYGKTFSDNSE